MPNIRPVSDLRNYTDVLKDISVGEPVFLTKNGRGRYVVIDMEDDEKTRATLKLMSEFARGERSGKEDGWTDIDVKKAINDLEGIKTYITDELLNEAATNKTVTKILEQVRM